MLNVLDEPKVQDDYVILDSPPTLAVADASVLASKVDGVVLVVDAGETRRGAGQRAVDQLTKVGANLLGVTLSKLSARRGGDYCYYYSDEGRRRRRPGAAKGRLARIRDRLAECWERATAKE